MMSIFGDDMFAKNSRNIFASVVLVGIFFIAILGIAIFNIQKFENQDAVANPNLENGQNNKMRKEQETTSDSKAESNFWKNYEDAEYDISFEYPRGWSVGEFVDGEVGYRELNITNPSLALIVITRDPNPDALTPSQWFDQMKSKYDPELMRSVGSAQVGGKLALFLSQPSSCRTVPEIVIFLSENDSMFTISQYERGSRQVAFELKHLLETLSVKERGKNRNSIPDLYFQYPTESTEIVCQ
jgi:hypothetical protein